MNHTEITAKDIMSAEVPDNAVVILSEGGVKRELRFLQLINEKLDQLNSTELMLMQAGLTKGNGYRVTGYGGSLGWEVTLKLPITTAEEPAKQMDAAVHRQHDAKQFFQELLDSVETLTGIADEHGARTLADLMYLQNAILSGSFIDHYPGESKVMEIASALPSGEQWSSFIKVEYMQTPADVVQVLGTAPTKIQASPVIKLQCCCCGSALRGRQWHNRDTGYGICNKCVDWVSERESAEEMLSNYGVEGIHYYVSMEYAEIKQAVEQAQSVEKICKVVEKADKLFLAGILKMTDDNWEEFTKLVGEIHTRLSAQQV